MEARRLRALIGSATLLLMSAAACTDDDDGISDEELAALAALGSVPDVPPDPSNAYGDDPGAADLGHKLFWDTSLSQNGGLSCASCHLPNKGWAIDDPRSTGSTGPMGEAAGLSNVHSQTVVNCGYQPYMFWNGRADSLWAQARGALMSTGVHYMTEPEVRAVIESDYADDYDSVFGGTLAADSDRQVLINATKAIAAYERLVVSRDSRFDSWLGGDDSALTEQELRGAQLFVDEERGCVSCHSGPTMSDGWFHDIGIESVVDTDNDALVGLKSLVGFDEADREAWYASDTNYTSAGPWSDNPGAGRDKIEGVLEQIEADESQFVNAYKTPTLRDVSQRAMLGRTGQISGSDQAQVLREWIQQYSVGGGEVEARNYTDAEIDDLVAFLFALDGTNDLGAYGTAP